MPQVLQPPSATLLAPAFIWFTLARQSLAPTAEVTVARNPAQLVQMLSVAPRCTGWNSLQPCMSQVCLLRLVMIVRRSLHLSLVMCARICCLLELPPLLLLL
eukprot:COSAG02_NODE_25474_length_657_cov_2.010753_1_plen_101_part_10